MIALFCDYMCSFQLHNSCQIWLCGLCFAMKCTDHKFALPHPLFRQHKAHWQCPPLSPSSFVLTWSDKRESLQTNQQNVIIGKELALLPPKVFEVWDQFWLNTNWTDLEISSLLNSIASSFLMSQDTHLQSLTKVYCLSNHPLIRVNPGKRLNKRYWRCDL